MELSAIGNNAQHCWNEIPNHFPHVQLDAFQVMPNRIHGIINIVETLLADGTMRNETMHASSLRMPSISQKSGSLARILGSYKSAVLKLAHLTNPSFKWQERYHDHIIRDEAEFYKIVEFIINKSPEL